MSPKLHHLKGLCPGDSHHRSLIAQPKTWESFLNFPLYSSHTCITHQVPLIPPPKLSLNSFHFLHPPLPPFYSRTRSQGIAIGFWVDLPILTPALSNPLSMLQQKRQTTIPLLCLNYVTASQLPYDEGQSPGHRPHWAWPAAWVPPSLPLLNCQILTL